MNDLNYNSVVLLDYMGSDKLHAVNAWASTFLEAGIDLPENIRERTDALVRAILAKGGRKRDVQQLIRFLAKNGHTSPFRSSKFVFLMREDIATHIQFLKHHVAIEHENAESARYKELIEDKHYMPEDWLDYGIIGKAFYDALKEHTRRGNEQYHGAILALTEAGMPKARAKESARYFKGYNSQLNVVRSLNFHGLFQVWEKRGYSTPAQLEIQHAVEGMVACVAKIPGNPFECSLKAFGMV